MKGSTSIVALLAAVAAAAPTSENLATKEKSPYRFHSQPSKNGMNWLLSPSESAPKNALPMMIKFYRDDSKTKGADGKSTSFRLDIESPKKVASTSSVRLESNERAIIALD